MAGSTFNLVTRTPANSRSLVELRDPFLTIVQKEFTAGRYIGPFSRRSLESLCGPFQSSPLSLVPKANKPGAFRLVQNYSFPRTPINSYYSINWHINSADFPCTWGTFAAFSHLVWSLPPGSQAAIRDVAEAYRTIPLHPSQWPGTIVRLDIPGDEVEQYAVDTNASFGVASHAGVFQ